MKIVGTKKLVTFAFLLGLVVPLGATAAYASIAYGSYRYFGPIDGYNYQNQATLDNSSEDYAGAYIQNSDYLNEPSGYMGIQATLYTSSGSICTQTSWYYMSGSGGGIGLGTYPGANCGAGNYYSKGWSRAYNGNGYDTYGTNQSPQLGIS
jgi:hypothetical protein